MLKTLTVITTLSCLTSCTLVDLPTLPHGDTAPGDVPCEARQEVQACELACESEGLCGDCGGWCLQLLGDLECAAVLCEPEPEPEPEDHPECAAIMECLGACETVCEGACLMGCWPQGPDCVGLACDAAGCDWCP